MSNYIEPTPGLTPPPAEAEQTGTGEFNFMQIARQLLSLTDANPEFINETFGVTPEQLARFGSTAISNSVRLDRVTLERDDYKHRLEIDQKTGALTNEAAQQAFAEVGIASVSYNRPMQVLFADLNKLKKINDSFGHDKGDEYLKATVQAFDNFFGDDSKIIRWNAKRGDEFIIVTSMDTSRDLVSAKEAQQEHQKTTSGVAKYVRSYLAEANFLNDAQLRQLQIEEPSALSVSVGGVFLMPEDIEIIGQEINNGERTLSSVIKRLSSVADMIMYQDKNGSTIKLDSQFEYSDLFLRNSKFTKATK